MRTSLLTVVLAGVLALASLSGCCKDCKPGYQVLATVHPPQFTVRPVSDFNQTLTLNGDNTSVSVQPINTPPSTTQIWNISIEECNHAPQIVVYNMSTVGKKYLAHSFDVASDRMSLAITDLISDTTSWQVLPSAAALPTSVRLFATSSNSPAEAFSLKLGSGGTVTLERILPTSGWGATESSFDWTTTIYP